MIVFCACNNTVAMSCCAPTTRHSKVLSLPMVQSSDGLVTVQQQAAACEVDPASNSDFERDINHFLKLPM